MESRRYILRFCSGHWVPMSFLYLVPAFLTYLFSSLHNLFFFFFCASLHRDDNRFYCHGYFLKIYVISQPFLPQRCVQNCTQHKEKNIPNCAHQAFQLVTSSNWLLKKLPSSHPSKQNIFLTIMKKKKKN